MAPIYRAGASWSSSTRFVIVTAVAVVSLSNVWRLPYLLSHYGGGAFLLVYVAALLIMGLPLFAGQLLLARGSGADVPGVITAWTRAAPHSRLWIWVGYLAVFGAALLLAAYSVVAGWSLAYSLRAVVGMLDTTTLEAARGQFVAFVRDSERSFGWVLVFFGLVTATASRGLRRGIEPVMRTLALCVLLAFLLLLTAALFDPRAPAAYAELSNTDFAALGWRGVLEALFQAFFTLSLGTGVIVSFGSYLAADARVIRLSFAIIAIDLLASLIAVFILSVFVHGYDRGPGAGLQNLFEVLAVAIGNEWQAPVFFVLVALVALSTGLGLFEPVVQLVQRRSGLARLRASVYCGVVIGLLGVTGLLSFGVLSGIRILGYDLFGWLLLVSTHLIGPLVGLLLCILLGRVLAPQRLVLAWGGNQNPSRSSGFTLWHALLRYPARIALVVVVAYSLGVVTLIEMLWQP